MTSQSLTTQDNPGRPWALAVARTLATGPSLGPPALRLTLAAVMFPHGAQKLLGWFGGYGFAGTMQFLESLGLPGPVAALVILIEFFGPVLLLLGLGTRLAVAGLAAIMVGAIATVHGPYGFFMNWSGGQAGEGFEYHLLVIGIAVALAISGAGRFSLDHRLASRWATAGGGASR